VTELSIEEEMLSAQKAGKLLGISGKSVIRFMEQGKFPGYHIGSAWKFKRAEILAYRESRRVDHSKHVEGK
jgi:excisionase family DNA binding protein